MHTKLMAHAAILLSVLFAFSFAAQARENNNALTSVDRNAAASPATASKADVRRVKFQSQLVGKTLPYNVILPIDYDAPAARTKSYPVLYLLHGLTGHYDDWATKSKLTAHAAAYKLIIITPEGNNSWYTDSPVAANEKYESYFVRELIPDVETRFRTLKTRDARFIAGLSMGGYGALKFGMKYPDMFALAASMSGALMAPRLTEDMMRAPRAGGTNPFSETLRRSIAQAFGAADSATRNENDIFKIARDASAQSLASLPFLYLDCGTEDGLLGVNREFAALLMERKIRYEFRELPGRHDWRYWDAQVQEILRVIDKMTPLASTAQR